MASASATSSLNISLEDHLVESLLPLLGLLPDSLQAELEKVLGPTHLNELSKHTPIQTIPYTVLADISKWTRTPDGERALNIHEPPLRTQDYSIVALLAGTQTSPERIFPACPTPSTNAHVSHIREIGDRRAVTAVLNALLSVGGAGMATWWAAGRLSWRDEWVRRANTNNSCVLLTAMKVLLGLLVAILVASSEAILYLIWEAERNKASAVGLRRLRNGHGNFLAAYDKKRDGDSTSTFSDCDVQTAAMTTATSPSSAEALQLRERFKSDPQ